MKKVIIVDDEKSGRTLIKEYLEPHKDLILLGEANNGVDAVKIINEFKPDLVFMDIQMPGMTGFDVLEHLEELPQIVFSTAYDQYALKAFEVHAVDYLLKPYTKERFDAAIARISEVHKIISLAEEHIEQKHEYPERIIVQKGTKYVTIATNDIYHVEAYGDYSKLHTVSDTFISNHGISVLEEKLDTKQFLRIHRSTIVHLDKIKEVTKYGKSYMIVLSNQEKVKVSRGYADKIKALIF
ncbi:LytTR family DNA-binding domain-containing protein [Aquimarina sp. MMG016]|uniref:LytR/AlgR family response regulator transcription factor n=1 Tax=Aquimarina sp. MMG016 TaxID=2822690 RepID=UPI001B3A57D8|nr:LytTR family DNA-binding domain-containing protein [Aquimarina sp. MMG016]MBQ4822597.1 response regulator transcription factor [Aquimarina sp. MMG016]